MKSLESVKMVLIPVDYSNSRKVCNEIQTGKFANHNELNEKLKEYDIHEGVLIYSLNAFMEEVNDQILDVLTEYFISYVEFTD
jgi:transposase